MGIVISFCKYAPPIVTSWASSNLSKQNLLAIEDFPTPLSPSKTILASIGPVPRFLALLVPAVLFPVPVLTVVVVAVTLRAELGCCAGRYLLPQHPPVYCFSADYILIIS